MKKADRLRKKKNKLWNNQLKKAFKRNPKPLLPALNESKKLDYQFGVLNLCGWIKYETE